MSDATPNESATIRPEALANELGVSGKLVRAFLRKTFPRPMEAKNTTWVVTNEQANVTRKHFLDRRGTTPNEPKTNAQSLAGHVSVKTDEELANDLANALAAEESN